MSDNKVKVEYTTVPLEKNLGETLPNKDGLPTHFVNNATRDCPFRRCHEKRKAWGKALILVLVMFFVSKLLFGWLAFTAINKPNDKDQYLWIETQEPNSNDFETGSTLTFEDPSLIPQKCEPDIEWKGPSEILVDATNTSGLIFNVKGLLARGSVTIRQDSQLKDLINITNHIYMGDESFQKRIDVKTGYADDSYLVTVETPSFTFPPKEGNCVLVNTIITIPYTVNVFRSLSVAFPNGWIITDSLGDVDFAYVNLKTIIGHIHIDDLSVANADISAVNGHIDGAFVVGESLEVRSINAPVNINVIPNPLSDSILVGFSSINGNLNIKVDKLKKHHKIELNGRSINGGIVATMPKTYKGDFLVSSVTGYAYVEGKGITFRKYTHNLKEGYKGHDNKKHHHCKHVKQSSNSLFDDRNSNLTLRVVTGASELYFV